MQVMVSMLQVLLSSPIPITRMMSKLKGLAAQLSNMRGVLSLFSHRERGSEGECT